MANVSSSNGLEKRPALSFRDDCGREFPSWHRTTLGTIIEPYSEKVHGEHDFEVLTSSREGLQRQIDHFGSQQRHDTDGYNIIPLGFCTYRNRSDDGRFTFNINKISDKAIVSKFYPVFRFKNANSTFMTEYLNSSARARKKLSVLAVGTSQVVLSFEALKSAKFDLPCKEEQDKIASLLECLNERVELQRSFVDALKKYKRGVMQHIFRRTTTQSVKAWTCVRLGDIFKKVSRRNTDGLVKNVITNSAEYGLIPQRDFFDKDIAVDGNTANYYVIEKGDFIYNPRKSNTAPYGPFNRYTLDEKGIISPLYTCLVLKADIYPSYLAWYFKSDAWHRYIYDNGSQGVRHDRVSMTDDLLMGIPVIFPDQAKQQEYADILDKIDARLQAAQKVYDLLIKEKCGYMQQLFI